MNNNDQVHSLPGRSLQVRGNHHPSGSTIATVVGTGPAGEGASSCGKRYRGTKNALERRSIARAEPCWDGSSSRQRLEWSPFGDNANGVAIMAPPDQDEH